MIFGHEEVLSRVQARRPPVSLFVGPASVGKATAAEHLRQAWRVSEGDTMRVAHLNTATARLIVSFASTAASDQRKLVIIDIDDTSAQATNILLKTLEERHESTDFILIAQTTPAAVIATRAHLYRFGYLTTEQVTAVLRDRNFNEADALKYAEQSAGQVVRALEAANSPELRDQVLVAVKAFQESNAQALEATAKVWTDDHTSMLASWCRESITQRSSMFMPDELMDNPRLPYRILQALNPLIRPRLLVRSNLMNVLKEA